MMAMAKQAANFELAVMICKGMSGDIKGLREMNPYHSVEDTLMEMRKRGR